MRTGLLPCLTLALAACSAAPVATGQSNVTIVTVSVDVDVAVPLDRFCRWFAQQGAAELSVFMTGRSALLPVRLIAEPRNGIVRSEALSASWNKVGDRRRLVFADGASAIEEITVDQPQRFRYAVSELNKDTGRYISDAQSDFRFSGDDRSTHIHWEYAFRPSGWPDIWFISSFVHQDYRQLMQTTLNTMQLPSD